MDAFIFCFTAMLLLQFIPASSFLAKHGALLVIFMFFNDSVHLLNLNFIGAHAGSDGWSTPKLDCDLALCLFGILELKKRFPDFLYVIRQTKSKLLHHLFKIINSLQSI